MRIKRRIIAAETLKRFVPSALAGECGRTAFVWHHAEIMALIVEALVGEKYLTVPGEKTCLCMFGVDTRKK